VIGDKSEGDCICRDAILSVHFIFHDKINALIIIMIMRNAPIISIGQLSAVLPIIGISADSTLVSADCCLHSW